MSAEEHRRIRVAAALADKSVTDFVRGAAMRLVKRVESDAGAARQEGGRQ
jgi:uncharacterized protein (DUF1778 family)